MAVPVWRGGGGAGHGVLSRRGLLGEVLLRFLAPLWRWYGLGAKKGRTVMARPCFRSRLTTRPRADA